MRRIRHTTRHAATPASPPAAGRYQEFLTACVQKKQAFSEQNLKDAFAKMDHDKNGHVTAEDLRQLVRAASVLSAAQPPWPHLFAALPTGSRSRNHSSQCRVPRLSLTPPGAPMSCGALLPAVVRYALRSTDRRHDRRGGHLPRWHDSLRRVLGGDAQAIERWRCLCVISPCPVLCDLCAVLLLPPPLSKIKLLRARS